jgi:hypothetical protein
MNRRLSEYDVDIWRVRYRQLDRRAAEKGKKAMQVNAEPEKPNGDEHPC